MSDFTIEQLEALKADITPGPWVAIADYPYISIVIANDEDQIHTPIVDITDGLTDEPEVNKHHELMAAAPALVDALIAEKRAHQKLRAEMEELVEYLGIQEGNDRPSRFYVHGQRSAMELIKDILEADHG